MAVDRDSLITRFPEFAPADPDLVTACIADAELMVDRTVFGSKGDMAVTHYAAHLIAINPLGEMARLDKKREQTVYLISFERIRRVVTSGFRVI